MNMKKFLGLFAISFLLMNSSFGQTQDSIEAYNKVKKWAVVKLTIAYMEDLKQWPSSTVENEYSKSDHSEVETYKELKKEFDLFQDDIDLDKVSQKLTIGWGRTKKNVFEKYKVELVDSIKPNSYNFQKIQFVPEKTPTTNNHNIAIAKINEKYNSLLPNPEKEVDIEEEIEVIPPQSDLNNITAENNDSPTPAELEENAPVNENKSNFGNMIVYIFLALTVLSCIFLIFKLLKANKKNNSLEKKLNNRGSKGMYDLNMDLQNNISSLKNKIELLQNENANLINKQLTDKKRLEAEKNNSDVEKEEAIIIEFETPKIEVNNQRIIYFPSPFESNRFANEDVSEIVKPTSLYMAEIDKITNSGIISLIETADLSRALNSPNTYLETACDYENAYTSSAKGIKVVEDGKVVLEGHDWIVKKKIKIKFI